MDRNREIILIDGDPVSRSSFERAMERSRVGSIGSSFDLSPPTGQIPLSELPPSFRSNSNNSLNRVRKIIKARTVGGAVSVTLPVAIREELGIADGDLVMVELDKDNRRILITKE